MLIRGQTDVRLWSLRERFLAKLCLAEPMVPQTLLEQLRERQPDPTRYYVPQVWAHDAWKQQVDVPSWLEAWLKHWHLDGSTDQWIELSVLRTLPAWIRASDPKACEGPAFQFSPLRPTGFPSHLWESCSELHSGVEVRREDGRYRAQPFVYVFAAIDQALEERGDRFEAEKQRAIQAWKAHLDHEQEEARALGYHPDSSRRRTSDDRKLMRLVRFQVLEMGPARIAKLERAAESPASPSPRRSADAQQRRLDDQAWVNREAETIRKDYTEMAQLIGLKLRGLREIRPARP